MTGAHHAPRWFGRAGRGAQTGNRNAWGRINGVRSAVRHRLGYRGLILLMFGLIYIMIGLAVIGAHDYQPELVHTHLPHWVRLCIWIIPGAVAVLVSADHKWQSLGFGLLFIPPAERAVSYFVAAITVPTWTRVPAFLIYVLVVVTVTFVASWPEPVEVQKTAVDQVELQRFASVILPPKDDEDIYRDKDGVLHDPNNPGRGE